ncbi:hypothetical protein Sango_2406600 [Sesamum angolense]|uniref:Uncharacterized protein n=1 Tax=Sesamum angolense TaxID=2727404 RepID=A0AAE1W752_9LAMI|nr:hypothetical protein Sango_2406600 [Sesamum angolense]
MHVRFTCVLPVVPNFPDGSKPVDQGTLTISGLHLTVIPFTKMSFFTDKKEVQRSSTALGYVAHAVSLIASYLQVLCVIITLGSTKPVEFPLFVEGQDSTRAAYAVFLLNKDLEQLLNFIGVKSLGHTPSISELKGAYKDNSSPEYIDM